jgi:dissimilatory sulfite reductase related protein
MAGGPVDRTHYLPRSANRSHAIRRKSMTAPQTDAEGYLIDPAEWTQDWARNKARELEIELNDDHWAAIGFMRAFWEEHQLPPDARFVMRHLSETRGAGRNRLFELFPYGYPGQACKIAGMKRPRIWSTG